MGDAFDVVFLVEVNFNKLSCFVNRRMTEVNRKRQFIACLLYTSSSHMAGREINVRLGRPLVNYETSEFVPPELYNTESFPKQFAEYSTPQHAAVLGYLCQLNQKFWAQGSNIGSKRKSTA